MAGSGQKRYRSNQSIQNIALEDLSWARQQPGKAHTSWTQFKFKNLLPIQEVPAAPVIAPQRAQWMGDAVAWPTYQPTIPFPYWQEPPPPNPVIAPRRDQWLGDVVAARVPPPCALPFPYWQPPPAAAAPVIPPTRAQLLQDVVSPRVPPPQVLPFPYFEQPASVVIAPRRDQWLGDAVQSRIPPPVVFPFPYFEQPARPVVPPLRAQSIGDAVPPRVPPPTVFPFPCFEQPAFAVIAPRRNQPRDIAPDSPPRILVAFPFFQPTIDPASPAPRLLMVSVLEADDAIPVRPPFASFPYRPGDQPTLTPPPLVVAPQTVDIRVVGPLFQPFPSFGVDFPPPLPANPIVWPVVVAHHSDRRHAIQLPRFFVLVGGAFGTAPIVWAVVGRAASRIVSIATSAIEVSPAASRVVSIATSAIAVAPTISRIHIKGES